MRLLVLDENYPHLQNLLGDVFVHVRVKEYARRHEVKVFSFFHNARSLEYEGVHVQMFSDTESLVEAVKTYKPDKILIHFYQSWMLEKIIKLLNIPVIIWVHGYEALGWYRRLFNYTLYSPVLLNYIRRNTKQQYHFHKLIKFANKTQQFHFVFVSQWMRRITEKDSLCRIKRYSVIPNPIDTNLFSYEKKDPELRKKVLLLRSFHTKKYANDIAVKAILALSKRSCFNDFSFTIKGDGGLFEETVKPIRDFKNVNIERAVVRQILIPAIHKLHGIFLCPTRQDAQGVSMCEAMSGGLVPVTSFSTAIPEFVTNNSTGVLTHSPEQIADALENLAMEPGKFSELSANAARSVRELCSLKNVIEKELAIIEP